MMSSRTRMRYWISIRLADKAVPHFPHNKKFTSATFNPSILRDDRDAAHRRPFNPAFEDLVVR